MKKDLIDRQALVEHYDSEEFEGKFVWSKSIVKYIQSLPAEPYIESGEEVSKNQNRPD